MWFYTNFKRISKEKYLLLGVTHHATKPYKKFRDHLWVDDMDSLHQVDPRICYKIKADICTYHGCKQSLNNITHIIKEPYMSNIKRAISTVYITAHLPDPVVASIQLNLIQSPVKSLLAGTEIYSKVNDTVIELTFHLLSDAKLYVSHLKALVKNNADLQTALLAPMESVAPVAKTSTPAVDQIVTSTEVLIQVSLPKAIKIFRQYPMVNSISVEDYGLITRDMANYQGKKLKAEFNGTKYTLEDGTFFYPQLVHVITERLQGELVTSAVMTPDNFVGIDGEYIITNIHGSHIKVHQCLINRHGDVFELEQLDGVYYEKGTELPIPVEILNIQTIRS